MPDKVLRVVAGLLIAACVVGFVMGIAGAPDRGRLPGEAAPGEETAPLVATEAKPLNTEELGPPKPPEPIAQEVVEEDEPEPPPPPPEPKPVVVPPTPVQDPVGQILDAQQPKPAPQPEEPPF